MKKVTYGAVFVSIMLILVTVWPVRAQAPLKTALPKVPVTYPGDTDKAIIRRAQWIEGARKEATMVWWGDLRPEEAKVVITEFNKLYPFVTINYWRGSGEEVAPKLEAEYTSGRYTNDITLGASTENFPRWRKLGMLDKFTDILPGVAKLDKRMLSSAGDSAVPGNHVVTPQYNTSLISSSEAPKKWDDLLDPKWKGKIGMTADMKPWVTLALEEGGWGIAKTEDFLRKIKQQQPIWGAGHSAAHQLLIAGEFPILVDGYLRHIIQSQKKGAPVDWCKISPLPVIGAGFILQKNAPHPNASRLFLEWVFSPQGLVAYERITALGIAFSGADTVQSKMLEGASLCARTEEGLAKGIELSLDKRLAQILGVTPE